MIIQPGQKFSFTDSNFKERSFLRPLKVLIWLSTKSFTHPWLSLMIDAMMSFRALLKILCRSAVITTCDVDAIFRGTCSRIRSGFFGCLEGGSQKSSPVCSSTDPSLSLPPKTIVSISFSSFAWSCRLLWFSPRIFFRSKRANNLVSPLPNVDFRSILWSCTNFQSSSHSLNLISG